ncbi:septation protein SepH [Actinocorallia sp. A-T 12471]|uniref:septation protein SepH n=1 Tax=Actinocorallia sp. A-T 12471 TaxID=3089813 RepID=UPI0029D22B04|nr:septation protein SepH [Actinocorallia sp. A-T 12471]MDX6739767.1 septation protein SepH [Actinocorallia sp. A-T 12471]
MQELRLVAVSEDGSYLVLATAGRGTRFTLPVDDRLRAAVRGHFSRLGQFEIEVESPLRPKEIQARIRAGETAEEIAESAGIPVERVRWFEGPVLQEREYMAQQAQRCVVRTPGEPTPGPPLGELVEERLGRRGADLEEVTWDAWKCEDNTWQIRLSFYDAGRPHAAEWKFDPRRRVVRSLDDEAARLIHLGEEEEPEQPADTVTPLRRPSMKIVSDHRREFPAGRPVPAPFSQRPDLADALPSLPSPPLSPEPFTPERFQRETRGADLPDLDALGALLDATAPTPPAPPAVPEPAAETASEPASGTTAADEPVASRHDVPADPAPAADPAPEAAAPLADPLPSALTVDRPAPEDSPNTTSAQQSEPEPVEIEEPTVPQEPTTASVPEPVAPEPLPAARHVEPVAPPAAAEPAPVAPEPVERPAAAEPTPEPEPMPVPVKKPKPAPVPAAAAAKGEPRPRKRPARNRRASVPSWDEIMFGARRPD